MFRFFNRFKYFDVPLLLATLLLVIAGLAILYATTLSEPTRGVFYRQLLFLVLGFGAFLFCSFSDYHAIAKANRVIYVVLVSLLLYLLVLRTTNNL